VATDTQITRDGTFKGVFCVRSAPDYKRTRNSFAVRKSYWSRQQKSFVQVSHSGRKTLVVQEEMKRVLNSHRLSAVSGDCN
jgi:hypothetical protein